MWTVELSWSSALDKCSQCCRPFSRATETPLEDWNELEQALSMFVSRMEVPIQPILAALPQEPPGPCAVSVWHSEAWCPRGEDHPRWQSSGGAQALHCLSRDGRDVLWCSLRCPASTTCQQEPVAQEQLGTRGKDPTLLPADHHPVLGVVEKHFATIERVAASGSLRFEVRIEDVFAKTLADQEG